MWTMKNGTSISINDMDVQHLIKMITKQIFINKINKNEYYNSNIYSSIHYQFVGFN